ncbi:rhodanese-like domain-containing protein [Acuticoccus sp.]|uniref:rhodanese-like domain-containing protein n=1 Tax=Acuticoccus sp. TaxID=1904378 RepID=UPI003B52EDF7
MSQEADPTIADASPSDTLLALEGDPKARLVDVRTQAEWSYVGVANLSATPAGEPVLLEWQSFPSMQVSEAFGAALQAAVPDRSAPLYFLCRSGVRSLAAAKAATALGYEACYNVKDGFEGPPDTEGHRGNRAGWKASGLPWRQS